MYIRGLFPRNGAFPYIYMIMGVYMWHLCIFDKYHTLGFCQSHTTRTNFNTNYLVMCKVYITWVKVQIFQNPELLKFKSYANKSLIISYKMVKSQDELKICLIQHFGLTFYGKSV